MSNILDIRLFTKNDVKCWLQQGNTSLYKAIGSENFPKPLPLFDGGRKNVWRSDDIIDWLAALMQATPELPAILARRPTLRRSGCELIKDVRMVNEKELCTWLADTSRSQLHTARKDGRFPAPCYVVSQKKISWSTVDIAKWLEDQSPEQPSWSRLSKIVAPQRDVTINPAVLIEAPLLPILAPQAKRKAVTSC